MGAAHAPARRAGPGPVPRSAAAARTRSAWRAMPTWWFHPLGIEVKRARTLVAVARVAHRLWEWATLGADGAAEKLALVPGVGPWTIGMVRGPVFGDDDAVPVGDFHFPHTVSWNLAGEPRGDDARMLELLEPYRPQRGRVLRLLGLAGKRAPAFGPEATDPADVPMVSDLDTRGRRRLHRADVASRRVAPGGRRRDRCLRRVAADRAVRCATRGRPRSSPTARAAATRSRASTRPMIEAIFTQWDGKWYRMIAEHGYPSELPDADHLHHRRRRHRRLLPGVPVPGAVVRRRRSRAASSRPCSASTSCCRSSPSCSSGCSPATSTASPRRSGRWCCSPCSPAPSCCRGRTPKPALIVCAAACLLFLQREQWVLAGVAAAIGTATRPNGIAIVAACVVAAAIAIYTQRQWRSLVASPWRRSVCSPTTPTSASTPASGGRGTAPSARPGTRAGAGGRRRSASRGGSSRTRSAPASGATYLHTALALAMLGFGLFCSIRVRLPWPMLAYVAVDRRVDDRPGDRVGATPVRVHGVPARPRHRRVVAAPAREAWERSVVLSAGGLAAAAMFYGSFAAIP